MAGKRLRLVIDTGTNKSMLFAKPSDNKMPAMTDVIAGKNQVIRVIRYGFGTPNFPLDEIDGFVGCDFFKGKRLVIAKDHIYISSR